MKQKIWYKGFVSMKILVPFSVWIPLQFIHKGFLIVFRTYDHVFSDKILHLLAQNIVANQDSSKR